MRIKKKDIIEMIQDNVMRRTRESPYKSARYYEKLADKKSNWKQANFTTYKSDPVDGYKGQDINLKCPVNNVYSSLPPGTEFKTYLRAPTSMNRTLYPTLRIPDGQYLYTNTERLEPVLNGKSLFYDTPFEDLNPIPGTDQVGYGRKLFPLTDEYMREMAVYSDQTLPYPDY